MCQQCSKTFICIQAIHTGVLQVSFYLSEYYRLRNRGWTNRLQRQIQGNATSMYWLPKSRVAEKFTLHLSMLKPM